MPPNTKTAKAVDAPAKPEATGATPTPTAPEDAPSVTAPGEVTGTVETRPGTAAAGDLIAGLAEAPSDVAVLVFCHRPQGIWRAGRFWPAEQTRVAAAELTQEQFAALDAEPLLSLEFVQE